MSKIIESIEHLERLLKYANNRLDKLKKDVNDENRCDYCKTPYLKFPVGSLVQVIYNGSLITCIVKAAVSYGKDETYTLESYDFFTTDGVIIQRKSNEIISFQS